MKSQAETIIEPKVGWQLVDWHELLVYKDLFYFLVWRDLKVLYKQTILGFTWAIIRPTFSMIVFSAVFGGLASIPSDGIPYPIFSYVALLPWTYASTALTEAAWSLVANRTMITKVYFPRLIIVMTPVLAKLVDFGIASIVLLFLMLWYGIVLSANVFAVPLLIVLMIITTGGASLWLAALAIQYRDIRHAMQFVTQLLMYAAPVVWPASLIRDRFGDIAYLLYGLYPMAGIIEGLRWAVIGATPMPLDLVLIGTVSSLVTALSGAFYFSRVERIFADIA